MIKRIVSGLVLLACVMLPAVPALASTSGSTAVSGTVPLIIYDVQASGITCHTATISWRTNGSASSQVFYDTSFHGDVAGYAHHSNLDNTLVVQHSVLLNGLSPTTYHYRVKSVAVIDSITFTAVSPDLTFTTSPTKPCVMTIWALPVGTNCALLWGCLNSRGSASSVDVYFQYGKTGTYGSETPHQTVTCELRIFFALVNNLSPDTTYHFRAVAVGDSTSYGDDKVFRTLPQPVITVVRPNGGESWKQGSRQTINWTYANVSGDVKIELLKGGKLYSVICSCAPKGTNGVGSYSWTIPSNQTIVSDYMIRVTSICEPSCSDTSNNNFSIIKK
jgi:hypothetical protein